VTIEEVIRAMSEAGHFPQIRDLDGEKWVMAAFRRDEEGQLRAPVVNVFVDSRGRWVLSSFVPECYQVPDERDVSRAAIAVLRAMSYCMRFSPDVIREFGLIELDHAEFETDDE
jgi:hypothetical protein